MVGVLLVTGAFTRIVAPLARFAPGSVSSPGIPLYRRFRARPRILASPMSSSSRITSRRSTALVWRTLRSMRTALILLLMLALASVAGSLVPQWPNSPERVVRYQLDHPLVGAFYGRAGLFDVFGSWWFVLITTLLFVSLVACLFPRTRALVRTLRQRPVQAREIDAFRLYEERVGAGGSRLERSTARAACCAAGSSAWRATAAAGRRSPPRRARSARSGACSSTGRSC